MAHNFHSNLPKDFEGFLHDVKSLVQERQTILNGKIKQAQQQCLNSKNEQDFLKCQTAMAKKLDKQESQFQFKMVFWRETSVQCFKAQEEKGASSETCRADSKKLLESVFDSFKL